MATLETVIEILYDEIKRHEGQLLKTPRASKAKVEALNEFKEKMVTVIKESAERNLKILQKRSFSNGDS